MHWSIEYYSEAVEQFILQLPPGLLARYLRLTDLMLEVGPNLSMPHTRAMGEGCLSYGAKARKGLPGCSTAPSPVDGW
jgi:hypothetical protein